MLAQPCKRGRKGEIGMKKRATVFLLVIFLALAAACGGEEEEVTTTAAPTAPAPTQAEGFSEATTRPPWLKMAAFYNDFDQDATFDFPTYDQAAQKAVRLPMESGGLWGVIDGLGATVIPPQYTRTAVFEAHDLLLALEEEEIVDYSAITHYGTWRWMAIRRVAAAFGADGSPDSRFDAYDTVYAITHEGRSHSGYDKRCLLAVKDGKQGLISYDGQVVVPLQYGGVTINADRGDATLAFVVNDDGTREGLWHLEHGQVAMARFMWIMEVLNDKNGRPCAVYGMKDLQARGVYDLEGNLLLAMADSDKIYDGNGQYVLASGGSNYWLDGDFNVLCKIPSDISPFWAINNAPVPWFVGDHLAYLSAEGISLLSPSGETELFTAGGVRFGDEWDEERQTYNLFAMVTANGKTTYYDMYLQEIEQPEGAKPAAIGDYLILHRGVGWGLIGEQGKEVLPAVYSNIEQHGDYICLFSSHSSGGLLLDMELNPVFDDAVTVTFDDGGGVGDGFLIVSYKGQSRAYSADGLRHLTKELYDEILIGSYGILSVRRGDKWALADQYGNHLTGFEYDHISPMNSLGFAGICLGGLWGSVDMHGNVVEPYLPAGDSMLWAYNVSFAGRYALADSHDFACYSDSVGALSAPGFN